LQLEESRHGGGSARRTRDLRRRAGEIEQQVTRALHEIRRSDEEFSTLQSVATFSLDEIRESLGSDALLLEYYQARGQAYVCVVGRHDLEIVPIGPIAALRNQLRLLQFQLSKFSLGPEFVNGIGTQLQTATSMHLRQLYDALIAPIRHRLDAGHLIVVPHDVLHSLPFHALFDGQRHLVDEFSVSYAPSASVQRLCWSKQLASTSGALVMGVPDALAPQIADEARSVASVLPEARLFVGSEATGDQLRRHGAGSRFVHIAAHGMF